MWGAEWLMSCFFRDKYDHHAVTLETVAAVPGIVGAAHRHLRSLRRMERDNGWIHPLEEEAENERMVCLCLRDRCSTRKASAWPAPIRSTH